MRKNRKVSKRMSVIATNTMRFGAIIVFFFVMVILNILSSSSCTQLLNEKGLKERELAKQEEAYQRESTRWEEMKTPEKIEAALFRHGLRMSPPRADQCVRLNERGVQAFVSGSGRQQERPFAMLRRIRVPNAKSADSPWR